MLEPRRWDARWLRTWVEAVQNGVSYQIVSRVQFPREDVGVFRVAIRRIYPGVLRVFPTLVVVATDRCARLARCPSGLAAYMWLHVSFSRFAHPVLWLWIGLGWILPGLPPR